MRAYPKELLRPPSLAAAPLSGIFAVNSVAILSRNAVGTAFPYASSATTRYAACTRKQSSVEQPRQAEAGTSRAITLHQPLSRLCACLMGLTDSLLGHEVEGVAIHIIGELALVLAGLVQKVLRSGESTEGRSRTGRGAKTQNSMQTQSHLCNAAEVARECCILCNGN